jgi:serine/threonine protein kinase
MILKSRNLSKSENSLIQISKDKKSSKEIFKSQSGDDLIILNQNLGNKKGKIKDYQIIKEIGEGAFGSVYLVQKENTNKLYALKILNKEFLYKNEIVEEPIIERNILTLCNHPSIVKLISTFQSKHKLYFVLEYIQNNDLSNLIKRINILPSNLSKQIISELINVIEYLHCTMKISHNDLKPGNIMLDENNHIKLIDFATAKIHCKIFDKSQGKFVDSDKYISEEIFGTIEYISPEMLEHKITDYRTNDIWALGIIIYIIFNGESPFLGKNDFFTIENIKNCKFKYINENMPEEAKDLINHILVKDPIKRYNISQIKSHKYFDGINWEDLLNKKIIIDQNLFEHKSEEDKWNNYFSQVDNFDNEENKDNKEFLVNVFRPNFSEEIIDNFYYMKYLNYDGGKNNLKNKELNNVIYEGVLTQIGSNKEIKFILYNNYTIDVINLENNKIIKKIKLSKKMIIKIVNETELIIDNDKFQSTKKEINKWYNLISDIYYCKD